MKIKTEIAKALALSQRDIMKLLRDSSRIIASLVFPVLFMVVFGVTFDSGLNSVVNQGNGGAGIPKNFFLNLVFSGILAQSVFQTSFSGIVSLITDREQDFAMSIFVAPVSRLAIVGGKIIGESTIAFLQIFGIILSAYLLGVDFSIENILIAIPFIALVALIGGSFGILLASRINTQETARLLFPFLILPLSFLSGAFTPISNLPPVLEIIKYFNPLYYGVDLIRNIMYWNNPLKEVVVAHTFLQDLLIFLTLGIAFLVIGTFLFTRKEGNR